MAGRDAPAAPSRWLMLSVVTGGPLSRTSFINVADGSLKGGFWSGPRDADGPACWRTAGTTLPSFRHWSSPRNTSSEKDIRSWMIEAYLGVDLYVDVRQSDAASFPTFSFFTIVSTDSTIGPPVAAWHSRCKLCPASNLLRGVNSVKDALGPPLELGSVRASIQVAEGQTWYG